MKRISKGIITLLFIAFAANARATLIDLTPGGVNTLTQDLLDRLNSQVFFDQAVHNWPGVPEGWVSRFGRINGGTYFFTDLFGRDTPTASISWNMAGQTDGFWMTMIDVFGRAADGTPWEHVYEVPWRDRFLDLGEIVTVHDDVNIMGISFFGANTIPDTGGTLLLLGLGAGLLLFNFSRGKIRSARSK
jgi:hypothetical protein